MMLGVALAWIVLLVLLAYGLIRWIRSARPPQSTSGPAEQSPAQKSRALEILEEAYARGEIAREEFLQKRDDLTGKKSDIEKKVF